MVDMQDCINSISDEYKLGDNPEYTVTQAAKMLGVSVHTLRYYDDLGLFPFLQKDESNKRLFSEADLKWFKLLECLRASGFSINEVQRYVELCNKGNSTIPERLELLKPQKENLIRKIEEEKRQLKLLQFKIDYYEKLLNGEAKF